MDDLIETKAFKVLVLIFMLVELLERLNIFYNFLLTLGTLFRRGLTFRKLSLYHNGEKGE